MTEVFRTDWPGCNITMQQLNWVTLNPEGVTDWHCHAKQTDHLVSVAGTIKLALVDGRPGSPTYRQHEIIRFGVARPILVTVPPGVWHALRNESGAFAGYINVIEHLYAYDHPDNFRPERPDEFPDIL
jgi:dTDP-4-dehydrorhamnose 3,5-epimerase